MSNKSRVFWLEGDFFLKDVNLSKTKAKKTTSSLQEEVVVLKSSIAEKIRQQGF